MLTAQVHLVSIRELASYVRQVCAEHGGTMLNLPALVRSSYYGRAVVVWQRAHTVYKLATFAPEMAWTIQKLQQKPEQQWRGQFVSAAVVISLYCYAQPASV